MPGAAPKQAGSAQEPVRAWRIRLLRISLMRPTHSLHCVLLRRARVQRQQQRIKQPGTREALGLSVRTTCCC